MGILKKLIKLTENSSQPARQNDLSNKVAKEMYDSNLYGYRDRVDALNYQQKLLDKVNAAREKYDRDGNLETVIKIFEEAFLNADPPCQSSQWKRLVDYYLKGGYMDKAWGYLQKVKLDNMKELSSKGSDESSIQRFLGMNETINMQEARVLKREKRFDQAVLHYIYAHVSRVGSGINFDKDRFFKDIAPCISKLKWTDDHKEYLAYLVQKSANEQLYFKERDITEKYREFIESVKKEKEEQ